MFTRKTILILLSVLLAGRIALLFLFPISDPSEARYALIIKRMAETGNFLEPQILMDGKWINFEGKPPLFFQSGAVCANVFGIDPFSVRLPALLAALGILGALYFALRKIKGERTALLALLFCSFSTVFFLFAGLAMTDMTLNLSVVCAVVSYMLFAHETERKRKKWYSLCFFASLAVGMLAKGPVAIVMAGIPVFFFVLINNRWKELKDHAWISGILLFLLIAAPWFILMTRKNPDFLEYFFVNENFKRFLFKDYGDRYGAGRETFRGMAVIWFLISNLPALLWLLPMLFRKEDRKNLISRKLFADPVAGLSLAGFLGVTLFWSMTSRVLITYLLPTIPFFSIWLADRMESSGVPDRNGNFPRMKLAFTLLLALYLIGFCALAFAAVRFSEKTPQRVYALAEQLPEYRDRGFYFAKDVPFSAAFFMDPARLRIHPDESLKKSLKASRKDLLFLSADHQKKYRIRTGRKELIRTCGWIVYAPAE